MRDTISPMILEMPETLLSLSLIAGIPVIGEWVIIYKNDLIYKRFTCMYPLSTRGGRVMILYCPNEMVSKSGNF